ncbi:MAG: disulfide reductase [Thermoproteota archaeon]|nr:MAG: disulfide reductase [Candidatus Korarchaeota archaeon]
MAQGTNHEDSPRIGVYICHCGLNIAGVIDCEKVAEAFKDYPGVVVSKDYRYMCSDPGQELIKEDIRKYNLNRVVVAACSPRMHEPTFRKCIAEAGLNPYLFEMANIREMCSWCHTHQREAANEKAIDMVRMAVEKARRLQPLETIEVPVTPKAMVIGGGVAGIQAALDLADMGFKVYMVEKSPTIGGKMALLDKTFPTLDCSICILGPKMVDVARHPNIELLSYSEVTSVDGFIGNFKVKVLKKPRYVKEEECNACGACTEVCPVEVPNEWDMGLGVRKAIYRPFPQAVPSVFLIDKDSCIECESCVEACREQGRDAIDFNMKPEEVELDVGAIIVATGFDLYDPTKAREYGYGRYPNVITNLEFERLVNAAGPTGGVVLRPSDGRPPRRVAFIQCVGSRNVSAREYCSRICCMATLKHAHQLKEKSPSTEVVVFYMDLRSFGKGYEEFYRRVQEEGVRFIRGRVSKVLENPDTHNLVVRCEDTLSGEIVEMEFDMVVLAAGLTPPSDAEHLQKALKISRSPDGFFLEAHPKLRPVETHVPGIYLCGTAQGPKDIPDTVAQASAAAAQASIPLSAGKVVVEPITAQVNEELCGGCRICESICAYGAIAVVETERGAKARVHEAICQGCGACSGACPSGAITMKHFTDTQILAQIRALTVGRW